MLFKNRQQLGGRYGAAIILALLAPPIMAADIQMSEPAASSQLAPGISDSAPPLEPAVPSTTYSITAPPGFANRQETAPLNSTKPVDEQTEQEQSHEINGSRGNNAVQRIFHERQMAERKANWDNRRKMELRKRWETRRAKLHARYQKLRQQAIEDGVQLPNTPPWDEAETNDSPAADDSFAHRPEESAALLAPNMPPNAEHDTSSASSNQPFTAAGPQTLSNQLDLERMQAVINGMTPEERDVCTTVHRLSMGLMQHSAPPAPPPMPEYYPAPRNYGIAPGQGAAGYDYPNGPAGYGPPPRHYNQRGYDRGMRHRPWQGDQW
jgi:hypothetical protein